MMPRERVVQLTIIRHGGALGYMMPKPIEEVWGYSVDELLSDIRVSLAGKAAEQVYLGTEFTGANSDLHKATLLAGAIIGHYGMNGSLYYVGAFGPEAPDARMKRDIERVLEDQLKVVKTLLAEYREAADELVDGLLETGNLTGDEVLDIVRRFEERKFGHASPEALAERNEERTLQNLVVARPTAGSAGQATTTAYGYGMFGPPPQRIW